MWQNFWGFITAFLTTLMATGEMYEDSLEFHEV